MILDRIQIPEGNLEERAGRLLDSVYAEKTARRRQSGIKEPGQLDRVAIRIRNVKQIGSVCYTAQSAGNVLWSQNRCKLVCRRRDPEILDGGPILAVISHDADLLGDWSPTTTNITKPAQFIGFNHEELALGFGNTIEGKSTADSKCRSVNEKEPCRLVSIAIVNRKQIFTVQGCQITIRDGPGFGFQDGPVCRNDLRCISIERDRLNRIIIRSTPKFSVVNLDANVLSSRNKASVEPDQVDLRSINFVPGTSVLFDAIDREKT